MTFRNILPTHPKQWGWTTHWAHGGACFNMQRGSTAIFDPREPSTTPDTELALEMWAYETAFSLLT